MSAHSRTVIKDEFLSTWGDQLLGKLELRGSFRSLTQETFSEGFRFGKSTIIYGHNGSGKSSLAELLYQLGDGRCDQTVYWTDEMGSRTKVDSNGTPPNVSLSVFGRSWIKENLADFLDGDTAAAIVTLGSEAVDAKKRQHDLEKSLEVHEGKRKATVSRHEDAKKATSAMVKAVQDAIEAALRDVDSREYNKNKYKDPVVRKLLVEDQGDELDEDTYQKNLAEVSKAPLASIDLQELEMPDWEAKLESVESTLNEGVDSQLIAELLGNLHLQTWLEEGIEIHEDESKCLFCEGVLSAKRMEELRSHFDESRKKVQAKAEKLLSEFSSAREVIKNWSASLPDSSTVYPELTQELTSAIDNENKAIELMLKFIEEVELLLTAKRDSPERTSFDDLPDAPESPGESIGAVTKKHNDIVSKADTRQKQLAKGIRNHIISSHSDAFKDLQASEEATKNESDQLAELIDKETIELQEVRVKQFSSAKMAEQISQDLASVYGKPHLAIDVTSDGQSYTCRREGQPAKHLSDGERNTLALIYYLRLLEDESVTVEKEQRILVIDDPSSSLDREAIFATHSWLIDALPKYGQTVILTHDFELLRLLLASQSNQLSKHRQAIAGQNSGDATRQGNATKAKLFPRVAFLEISGKLDSKGHRFSRLHPISDALLNHKSEYHFLFDRIIRGLENPDDHEALFLLPNAARRLIETFSSFHAPDRPNFLDQLSKLAIEERNAEYRDVYDFCNRFSHGEGRETQVFLDVQTTQQNLRRCMEFLRAVDARHYTDMCRAVGRKDNDPLDALV